MHRPRARPKAPHNRRSRRLTQHPRSTLNSLKGTHSLEPTRFLECQFLGEHGQRGQSLLCALLVLDPPARDDGVGIEPSAIAAKLTGLEGEGREVGLVRVES